MYSVLDRETFICIWTPKNGTNMRARVASLRWELTGFSQRVQTTNFLRNENFLDLSNLFSSLEVHSLVGGHVL